MIVDGVLLVVLITCLRGHASIVGPRARRSNGANSSRMLIEKALDKGGLSMFYYYRGPVVIMSPRSAFDETEWDSLNCSPALLQQERSRNIGLVALMFSEFVGIE